jgi:deoxyribonuclease V
MSRLIVAMDVHYDDERQLGRAAAVVFFGWEDESPRLCRVLEHPGPEPYVPGQFYRRELPCLLPLLEQVRKELSLGVVIVDGHVDLGPDRPGLGRHLYDALGGAIEVVGVAKSAFEGAPALPLLRGRSARPLWVSSTDCAESAVRCVASMHGRDRVPTLLRRVDQLARGVLQP